MRIIWNDQDKSFQAELTPGDLWRGDMEAAKAAGFRTAGPPSWTWSTQKASVLNKLRDHKPESGLTLTEVALSHYKQINEREEKKAALKKQFQELQKKAKKESKEGLVEVIIPEKGYISREDLEPRPDLHTPRVFAKPEIYCVVCGEPLYVPFPDYDDVCHWCK